MAPKNRYRLSAPLGSFLNRAQRRALKHNGPKVERATDADGRYFERLSHRRHRLRWASAAEVSDYEAVRKRPECFPEGHRYAVVIRNVAPGVRQRVYLLWPEDDDTDIDEEHARHVFEANAPEYLDAMAAVRKLTHVVVVGRTPEHAEALVRHARSMGLDADVGGPDAVAVADIVCTCTTGTEPLFDGAELAEGAHVNAIGAYQLDAREVDTETVRRAKVVVETREAALAEAGDLAIPIAEGAIGPDHVLADLQEAVRGARVRAGAVDVTLFVSVGLAFEDLAVAGALAATL